LGIGFEWDRDERLVRVVTAMGEIVPTAQEETARRHEAEARAFEEGSQRAEAQARALEAEARAEALAAEVERLRHALEHGGGREATK
jgi:hypothetical protein